MPGGKSRESFSIAARTPAAVASEFASGSTKIAMPPAAWLSSLKNWL